MSNSATRKFERQFREFTRLQQFLLADNPERAEHSWRRKQAFEALPAAKRAGDKEFWLQYEGDQGYIHYAPGGQGRYWRELPKNMSPENIIRLPRLADERILLNRFKAVAAQLIRQPRNSLKVAEVQRSVANLEALYDRAHRNIVLRRYQEEAFAKLTQNTGDFLKHLVDYTEHVLYAAWPNAEIDGEGATGFLVLRNLAQKISSLQEQPFQKLRFLGRIPDRSLPVESALHLAAQITRDAISLSFAAAVREVAIDCRKTGAVALEAAREGFQVLGQPGSLMENFYWGLFFAIPHWRSAQILFEILKHETERGTCKELNSDQLARESNNAEEHVVRLINSIKLGIDDLDGERFRGHCQEIAFLRAQGKADEAEIRLLEIMDFHFFYPKPLRAQLAGDVNPTRLQGRE